MVGGRLAVVLCLAASVSACGSITRGTTEPVAFVSDPPGAQMIASKDGYACPVTPCSLNVGRADEFDATFTKAGYQPTTVPVRTKVVGTGAAGMAGNIIAGGIVGIGVDAATGAAYDHTLNPVSVTLVPDSLSSAQRVVRTKRGRPAPDQALPVPGM